MEPVKVRFETETTAYNVKKELQALLDDLHRAGILRTTGTIKVAKINVKPYYRNTFEVVVEFQQQGEWWNGRHAGLRNQCRKAWEFESPLPYHYQK